MGYIRIPKLGSSDEPIIDVREMPQEWQYYKTLAQGDYDNCFLFYKGASSTFAMTGLTGETTVTLYGGLNGKQPLYRCFWSNNASDRYWAKYVNGRWVKNIMQIASPTACVFRYADLDDHPEPFPITFNDLQGKPITNDPHLGTTELFTVIVHPPENVYYNNAKLYDTNANGGSTTNSRYTYPLVAYYGASNGLKASDAIRTPDLEFIEFYSAESITAVSMSFAANSYWLGSVTIPDGITMIIERGCLNARNLQEFTFSEDATSVPNQMFNNCFNLKKVTLGDSIETIGSSAFRMTYNLKSLELPDTVESIGQYAFLESGVENINFPSSLTTIDSYAFQSSKIKNAILPDSVQTIGGYVFDSCYFLETVRLPNQLANIDASVFNACSALKEISLPSTIVAIGNNAFYGCSKLGKITLPSNLASIGNYAFYSCYNIEEITIPTGCVIGTFAFGFCDNLKKVTLPAGFTTLNNSTFVQCRSLEEITLPDSLLSIGSSAFANCHNLKSLVIPPNVMSILASAFAYTGACRYVKMTGAAPNLANANAFGTANTYLKILIPYDYIDDYQTATNWSSNTNNILRRQRGYKTFNEGDNLPATDSTGNYTLTWYDDFNAILNATATGTPSAQPVTTASHDGEYYCIIS